MTDTGLPPLNTPDIWEQLADADNPICIYGTGNGADKIINELDRRGIPISGVFASDGFVRERDFRGHRVVSYGDMCRRYERFTALLAFGTSRPDVIENINRIAAEQTLLCPDVPAFGSTVFDSRYYRDHYAGFGKLSERLADEKSRQVLSLILKYKLTGELAPLYSSASVGDPGDGILDYGRYKTYVDLGAYTGDTVRITSERMTHLRRVYALEPEPRAYRKLTEYAAAVGTPEILTYNAAAWSCETTLDFTAGSGRGSSASARTHKGAHTKITPALSVDGIVTDHIDYIKFDVEGAEAEALRGASVTIHRDRPDLLISVYHRTEDLLELPDQVLDLCPDYKLYLRREQGLPAWGINLYAVI